MPRPKPVPPLTISNAPRVFLDILSRSKHDRDFILNHFREALVDSPSRPSVKRPSVFFNIIVGMETPRQKVVLKILDEALNDLLGDDVFGTEGQLDPRGDHRG